MHLIPWVLLKQALIFEGDETTPDAPVTMSFRTLRLLIEAALAAQPFDELAYLRANPDVARSVRDGRCPSALAHYEQLGYYEGRMAGRIGFDEDWYLSRYPDIKRAVALGECPSGHEHYSGAGLREWRSPNETAEPDIFRWHQAVSENRRVPPRGVAATKRQKLVARRVKA